MRRRRLDDARSFFEQAGAIFRDRGDRWNLAQTLHHLGRATGDPGPWRQARDLLTDFDDLRAAALRQHLTEALRDR